LSKYIRKTLTKIYIYNIKIYPFLKITRQVHHASKLKFLHFLQVGGTTENPSLPQKKATQQELAFSTNIFSLRSLKKARYPASIASAAWLLGNLD